MKKILKELIIIIISYIMLLSLLTNKPVHAVSAPNSDQAECGRILSAFCVNFWDQHHEQTIWDASSNREITYTGRTINGIYHFDCVGWVSFAVHQSLKMGDETFTYFAVPPGNGNNPFFTNGFELVKGSSTDNSVRITLEDLQPGDILFATGHNHVLIYVGNDTVIHSSSGTLSRDNVYQAESSYCAIGRITPEAAARVVQAGNASEFFNGQGGITRFDIAKGGFNYNGLQASRIGVRKFEFPWEVLSLKDILDWYIGISTYITRAIYVGLVETVEILIDNTMEAVTGIEASLTIEKLVFNKVPILDVNFFNFEEAGGQEIIRAEEGEDESILYVIRENIAIWYNVMRNISIILLLITLLYIGIRIAISSAAEQKAKYKELLKSWFTSFIIVFSIHYIMIFILTMNQMALDGINNVSTAIGGEESLYDSVRNGAYAIQASIGWRSLLFYVILVYMLIRFLWTYIKRFIVVAILTLMAPLIGILYALDKIRDNKAQSFEKWFKEYLFNVIIQSVHALLYSLFVGLAFNIAGESFRGVFVAAVLMMFILVAERIFKQIFGIKSGNMTDVLKSTAGFALAGKAVKTIVGTNFKTLSKVASPVTKPLGQIHRRADEIRRDKNIDKLKDQIDRAKAAGRTTVNIGKTSSWTHPSRIFEGSQQMDFGAISDLDSRKIAKSLYEKKEAIDSADKKELANRLSQVGHTAAGIGLSAVAIPSIAIDGAQGAAPLFMGKAHFKKGIKGFAKQSKNYREYKGAKGTKQKAGRAAAEIASAGMYGNLQGLIRLTKDYEETRANSVHNAQYEILKKELDKKAKKEYERLLNDASIDETELRRVYSQAKTKISEDVIQDVVFRIDAGKDTYIVTEIGRIAASTSDINSVAREVNSSMKKKKKVYDFDRKEFDKQLKSKIRQDVANDRRIRTQNVTETEIEAKYRSLSSTAKEKLIKDILDGTSKLTEERMEDDKWRRKDKLEHTNMNLENVNTIIDELAGETKRLNVPNFKANFSIMIRQQIHMTTGASIASITNSDVDRYISNMTHDQLIKSIKAVSAVNSSVVDDNLRKTEYDTLLDIVEKAKDAEIKMKGKK